MPARRDHMFHGVMLGIGLTVLAYFLFAFQDASIKWLVVSLPVWQIMFCRSITVVIACLAIGRRRLVTHVLTTPNRRALGLRAGLTLLAWLCYYSAAAHMQLAQMLTLYYAAPVMVTVMAIPLLGERVTRTRWVGVAIGFSGVLVAANPFGASFGGYSLLVLTAAALWAYALILMRQISAHESSLTQVFTNNLVFLVTTGLVSLVAWHPPSLSQAALLAGIGVFGGIGQFALFEGARSAPASVTSTFEYTSLVWAFILGYLIWHDLPPVTVVAGAVLILSAGLLLVVSERRAQRQLAS
jgi:drug/metabolite transporter (DMT)-like permease